MTSPLLLRLQPLLQGVQQAEDFVQEILKDGLTECLQRISIAEKIPVHQIQKHADCVLEGMKIKLQDPPEPPTCRALTKKRQRCKKRARHLSEFCGHHQGQREKFAREAIVRVQLLEHDARRRASRRKDHNHVWDDDEGFVADCAACGECMPARPTNSAYSGQSMEDESSYNQEVQSARS